MGMGIRGRRPVRINIARVTACCFRIRWWRVHNDTGSVHVLGAMGVSLRRWMIDYGSCTCKRPREERENNEGALSYSGMGEGILVSFVEEETEVNVKYQ